MNSQWIVRHNYPLCNYQYISSLTNMMNRWIVFINFSINEIFSITFLYTFPSSHNNIAPQPWFDKAVGRWGCSVIYVLYVRGWSPLTYHVSRMLEDEADEDEVDGYLLHNSVIHHIIAYEFFVSLSIGVSLHTVNGGKDVLQSLAISKRLSHKSGFCHVLHSRGHRVPTSGLPPNRQDNQEAPLDPRTSQRT